MQCKKWRPKNDSATLFDVFSDICVKHDPTAGCHKGPGDDRCLFSEVHFHSLFFVPLASVQCMMNSKLKNKCGQEEEHKKNERMKMWKNIEGKKWEDKSLIERK